MNVVETILVFVGIPLAVIVLLALLTFVPGGRKRSRYKSGQPWEHDPGLVRAAPGRSRGATVPTPPSRPARPPTRPREARSAAPAGPGDGGR